ncbi:NlpC/P60 family N-terminal domain-containing protein [Mailhella sp.]|uniref:NlpC/P60 family N-terminal domain-containing protein n=1 Tax=Mailhella sp. TaxID=1981029 RepID=UPI003AB8B12E
MTVKRIGTKQAGAVGCGARTVMLGLVLCGAVLASGCAGQPRVPQESQNAAGDVKDVQTIPQSLAAFARQAGGDAPLRSAAAAERDMASFRRHFFSPWEAGAMAKSTLREFEAVMNWTPGKRGYAENLRPWTDAAWENMRYNAALDAVSGRGRAAIVTRNADLRLAPTVKPRFARVEGAGQGWPFDDFQQSSVAVGTPLMAYHASRDGAWLLVRAPMAWGWIAADSVAFADEDFQRTWKAAPLGAVVKEGVSLKSAGAFLALANIGAVLPMNGSSLLVPVRGSDARAGVVSAPVEAGDALPMPQPLTARAVAVVGDRMMGESYGWGGMYGNRDCSAMMRDLFASFGVWLPRNSSAQAKAGDFHSLQGLSADAKEKAILQGAEPFRTLLWLPGHIGLYVGSFAGDPVFFHDIWGVRSRLRDGREGRVILGRAVITGLRPGAERSDSDPRGLLIERMRGYSIIGGR